MFKIGQEVAFTKYYPDLHKIKQRFDKALLCRKKNPEFFERKEEEYYELQYKIHEELKSKLKYNNSYITNGGFIKIVTDTGEFMYIKPSVTLSEPTTGKFCGYKLQKIIRIYRRRDIKFRQRGREELDAPIHPIVDQLNPADQISGRYSQNIRVDNPRQLSKVAIIAISPTVRMEVPMDNLIFNNKRYNFL